MQTNRDSTSDTSAAQRQRLPVNPRRAKVAPEERKRVIRACNACNIRRVRCSGDQPCQRCRKASRECEYPTPESDKSALKSEVDRLRKRCAALEKNLQLTAPHDAADNLRQFECGNLATCAIAPVSQPALSGTADAEVEDGRLLSDSHGIWRYLGETSGATFLDNLKHFMSTLVPLTFGPNSGDGVSFLGTIGQYQTFDSRPLPNPDVDALWLPSQTEMSAMLAELRYYVQDGNDNFPSGGIYWWGDLSSVPPSLASSTSLNTMTTGDSFRYLAYYHVCFALASSVGHTSFRHSEQHTSEAYVRHPSPRFAHQMYTDIIFFYPQFKRARLLLGNPLDFVRFTLDDVPVLTLMAFYLIEINRRDAAYMYVGLAVRIALIHGAFRSCRDEAGKRRIWTLYILDRWLSVLLGRPPTIADEAIRLSLPSDVASMPPSAGLRAHVELSRISGYIVCETFKIAPRNCKSSHPTNNIDIALKMLQTWQAQLPSTLQMTENFIHRDPSCGILHMAHNQLVVLTTRPVFFAAVKQAVAQRFVHGRTPNGQHCQARHIQACPAAAHRNLLLAQLVVQSSRKLLQAGLHFVFNAAVILLLNRIITSKEYSGAEDVNGYVISTPPIDDQYASIVDFAIRSFEEEARTGTNYVRDCCRVLQDLRALVGRYLAVRNQDNMHSRSFTSYDDNVHLAHIAGNSTMGIQPHPLLLSENNGIYEDVMTWVQSDGLQLDNSLFI